jgi:hypothetical protein
MDTSTSTIVNGQRWRKVSSNIAKWQPEVGEVLTGVFIGMQTRSGQFGSYSVAYVRTADKSVRTISGSMLIDLISLCGIDAGDDIMIVYNGLKPSRSDETKKFKDFALFISEDQARATVSTQEPKKKRGIFGW